MLGQDRGKSWKTCYATAKDERESGNEKLETLELCKGYHTLYEVQKLDIITNETQSH